MLGNTLQIVYFNMDLAVRKLRSREALEFLADKDKTKEARGAGRVKDKADLVLDSNGPFEHTVRK